MDSVLGSHIVRDQMVRDLEHVQEPTWQADQELLELDFDEEAGGVVLFDIAAGVPGQGVIGNTENKIVI